MPSSGADPILLSLFANRFMAVAESMGRSLQQTSISTNIKERLDFSCAIFAADGSLIANAPHLPVHLGSMSFAVQYQAEHLHELGQGSFKRGDVVLANHPAAGGSHLPDITCITPVFAPDRDEIVFFTASRGHHADIGGILPGSMPPTSKTLFQEGAQIRSFKIVSEGVYDQKGLMHLLLTEPAKYPGCSGTRCFRDVESDLKAQIAANHKGIQLLNDLVHEWGLETVQSYMMHIRDNAEFSVRNLLRRVANTQKSTDLHAIDYMDDGSPIELHITINPSSGSAIFDFEGTGPEVNANHNCPKSVVYSAIIYALRCMVSEDIPLNQGCLAPIDVRIPEGSMLSPSDTAAVVGGNVLTSQRITDVVFRAFEAVAASQGDCNNLTFGTGGNDETGRLIEGFGYYETIAGGSGAGPSWHGTSGVHTHMTNTRITDPEIFERRYPVYLRQFGIREGSGGAGHFRGGNGVIRDIEFLEPSIHVSILSERRVYQPYGLCGGEPAASGLNLWIKQRREEDGDLVKPNDEGFVSPRVINLGGKSTAIFGLHDRIIVHTPGGGGYGTPSNESPPTASAPSRPNRLHQRGSVADWQARQLGA